MPICVVHARVASTKDTSGFEARIAVMSLPLVLIVSQNKLIMILTTMCVEVDQDIDVKCAMKK